MNKITVLITGIGGGGIGEQILKALRISDYKYTIIGADITPISYGSKKVEHFHIVPTATHPDYIPSMLKICQQYDVKALFYGSEMELKVMSEHRSLIESKGIFLPINPPGVIDTCLNKLKTVDFLNRAGFKFPKSFKITNKAELENVDIFPVVLKPSIGGGGSANILLAQTQEELKVFGEYLLTIYSEFIIQEYVGTPENEFTVGVLSSMEGDIINAIGVKRMILNSLSNKLKVPNRTNKINLGKTLAISGGISQGEIGEFPEVTKSCIDMAKLLGSKSSINIQLRYVDGEIYVFEINPRFSGTTSMRAMVGYNEPDILIRKHVFGESIKPFFKYKSGYVLRGLAETFIEHESTQAGYLGI